MTVLCVARKGGKIALAADGQTTAGGLIMSTQSQKIWRSTVGGSDWLFAGTGGVRNSQVVQHQFTPPHGDETDINRYMIGTFIPALRTVVAGAGIEWVKEGVARFDSLHLLAVRGGHIFAIGGDYSVMEMKGDFWADGCGREFALGAMHATGFRSKGPDAVARAGVEAAIKFDAFCSGGIQVEEVGE